MKKTGNDPCLPDTNIVIDLLKGQEKIAEGISRSKAVYLPVFELGELYLGVENSGRKAFHYAQIEMFLKIATVLNAGIHMSKNSLFGLALLFAVSCNQDDDDRFIKQENGTVWISGGLMYCPEQLHLDSGDTLIVNLEDIVSFTSDDRVRVKYREMGINEFCSPGIDCEIIDIIKVE